ncbi:DNA mismatch repair endonuclease MutL [Lawsonibacter sp. LCP25S3_F5]
MPEIAVLDPHVADLIAAGEVVERPASAAKELIENAVDAGASIVTVEIAHGGMTFLRVTDDGSGIPAGQLKTAFLRHATSKLHSARDLEAIGTLGFRGEALAAICAVSRMEVLTCTADAPLGASLTVEGGVPGQVEEAGCPQGTTMVVRDLFYNTPARQKFLKKDAAEGAAVFAVVQKAALSHPEVSFHFIRDGKQELMTPGDGQLKSAVYAVLGRELALGFRPVQSAGEDMSVTGFVSMPACCRASRNWQFFFVNGRPVKSPLMTAAVEQAYQNQKMVGKFPGCVLHLDIRRSAVDVNVHPAKSEVKFGSERQVFSAVYHAVLSALEADRSRPQVELKPRPIPGVRSLDQVTEHQLTITPRPAAKPAGTIKPEPAGAADLRPVGAAVPSGPSAPVTPSPRPSVPVRPATPPVNLRVQDSTYRPLTLVSPVSSVAVEKKPEILTPSPVSPAQPAAFATAEKPHVENLEPKEPERPVGAAVPSGPSPEPEQPQTPEDLPWRMVGEVLHTYIVVEQGDRVFFIDKHAAHERMNFDRMKAQGYDPMAQTLLSPVLCRLPAEEQEVLLSHQELLGQFGFDVDQLGDALAVRQAPFDVDAGDIETTLSELAQKLLTTGDADPAAARDELLHTMACKAAIKGGWKTSDQELERVAQAVMSGQVKYCPHGRPVAIELTQKELEKQFKRS